MFSYFFIYPEIRSYGFSRFNWVSTTLTIASVTAFLGLLINALMSKRSGSPLHAHLGLQTIKDRSATTPKQFLWLAALFLTVIAVDLLLIEQSKIYMSQPEATIRLITTMSFGGGLILFLGSSAILMPRLGVGGAIISLACLALISVLSPLYNAFAALNGLEAKVEFSNGWLAGSYILVLALASALITVVDNVLDPDSSSKTVIFDGFAGKEAPLPIILTFWLGLALLPVAGWHSLDWYQSFIGINSGMEGSLDRLARIIGVVAVPYIVIRSLSFSVLVTVIGGVLFGLYALSSWVLTGH